MSAPAPHLRLVWRAVHTVARIELAVTTQSIRVNNHYRCSTQSRRPGCRQDLYPAAQHSGRHNLLIARCTHRQARCNALSSQMGSLIYHKRCWSAANPSTCPDLGDAVSFVRRESLEDSKDQMNPCCRLRSDAAWIKLQADLAL